MKFGYARVSKSEQNLHLQIDALRAYGVDEIFEEKVSSKTGKRPELERLLAMLRAGDTIAVWGLDRLGRTVKQLLELAESFEEKGIYFVSLRERLDTTTASGKFCFHMFCAVAQMERDVISERTKAGLDSARERGRLGGRKGADPAQVEIARKMYASNEFTIQEILGATGMKRSTLYKYLNLPPEREERGSGD